MNLRTNILLYATLDGEVEFHSFARILEQIADLAAEKRISRILLDGRFLTGRLRALERIDLAVKATDYQVKLGIHPSVGLVGQLSALAAQVGRDRDARAGLRRQISTADVSATVFD